MNIIGTYSENDKTAGLSHRLLKFVYLTLIKTSWWDTILLKPTYKGRGKDPGSCRPIKK